MYIDKCSIIGPAKSILKTWQRRTGNDGIQTTAFVVKHAVNSNSSIYVNAFRQVKFKTI